jgi:hypothetical protein
MKLLPGVMRFHGRDIVRVEMPGPLVSQIAPGCTVAMRLTHQPFYRSSGRNSGRAGSWLPFDGIVPFPDPWFDKSRFCHELQREGALYRYGTEDYKTAGEMLDALTIEPAPEIDDIHAINRWLGLY